MAGCASRFRFRTYRRLREPICRSRPEISPPPGYRIVDTFPSTTAAGGESGTVTVSLPAPPSLLRFRVVPEGAIAIGLAAFVDGAVALLFIGLAVFGARRLLIHPPSPDGRGQP